MQQKSRTPYANYNIFAIGRLDTLHRDFPSIEHLPKDRVEEVDDPQSPTGTRKQVKGDGGHVLTSEFYQVYDTRSPQARFIAGHQATMKVLLLANYARFNKAAQEGEVQERDHTMYDTFKKLRFAQTPENESNPDKDPELRSRLMERHQEALDYLKQVIETYKAVCARIRFSEVIETVSNPGFEVASDVGGRFLGSFLRKFETLDAHTQEVVQQLTTPIVSLTPAEVSFYTQYLIAYEALHRPISQQDAYQTLRKDWELYQKEYGADKQTLDRAWAQLLGIEEDFAGNGETTISRVAEVCQKLHFLYDFRVEQGEKRLRQHFSELERHFERFRSTFFDPQTGQLLKDCQRGSVPRERLRETPLGTPIGYRPGTSSKQPPLSRDDFYALMTGTSRWEACGRDFEALFRAMSVEDSRELVTRVLVAGRKADAFDAGKTNIVGSGFIPVEDFLVGKELTQDEFKSRMRARYHYGDGEYVCSLLDHGLVESGEVIEDYFKRCAALVPRKELAAAIEFVGAARQNPFIDIYSLGVGRSLHALEPILNASYFKPREAQAFRIWLKFKEHYDKIGLGNVKAINQHQADLEKRSKSPRIVGSVHVTRRLVLGFEEGQPVSLRRVNHEGIEYSDVASLEPAIKAWDASMVAVTALSDQWKRKLAFLISTAGSDALRERQYAASDRHTIENIREFLSNPKGYAAHVISRDFVEEVEALNIQVPPNFDMRRGLNELGPTHHIGPNDLLYWGPDGQPVINFYDKFKGRRLLDVVREKPGMLWYWRDQFDFGRATPEQCDHIRKIVWYLDKFHVRHISKMSAEIKNSELFLQWLERCGYEDVERTSGGFRLRR